MHSDHMNRHARTIYALQSGAGPDWSVGIFQEKKFFIGSVLIMERTLPAPDTPMRRDIAKYFYDEMVYAVNGEWRRKINLPRYPRMIRLPSDPVGSLEAIAKVLNPTMLFLYGD
jgi:hypothetical protein